MILGARSMVQQVVVLGGTILLTKLLDPGDYGTFAIVQFVMSLFRVVGDTGLGPSLIQQTETPTQRVLSTVFWTQLAVTSAILVAAQLGGGFLVTLWPDQPADLPNLFRALSFSLLLTMLRVIPSIMLERELRYIPLALSNILGTLGFYGTATTLAWAGAGTGALVGAVLAQSTLSLITIYVVRPWRPSFTFERAALPALLRFGIFFQGRNIIGMVNGAVAPVLAGGVLGAAALGYNNYARNTAWFPLQVVSIIGQVSFPLFSRLAHDREALAAEMRFSLLACGTAAIAFAVLFFGLGPQVVSIIYHPKWLPAMPALYIYSVTLIVGFIAPIAAAAFDGVGKPEVMFRLSVFWTTINVVVVSAALYLSPDLVSFAAAYCVHVVVGNVATLYMLGKELPGLSFFRLVWRLLVVGAGVAAVGRFVVAPRVGGLSTLVLAVTALAAAFVGLAVLVDPKLRTALGRLKERLGERRRKKKARDAKKREAALRGRH